MRRLYTNWCQGTTSALMLKKTMWKSRQRYVPKFVYSVYIVKLTALAQMVSCLPLVQQVWGSIPGRVVKFNLKIFNLGARRGENLHFLIARLYITVLD